jgi:succinate-acetate transporter protein
MGIFYGGMAQIIAGIMEYNKKNTFGTTAFTSYGLFWISLVALLVMPVIGLWEVKPNEMAMGWYFLCWGVFTAMMFIGTLKANRVLQFIFASLALLFFLLTIKEWMVFYGADPDLVTTFTHILGYEGIICGASAFYLAMAEVINEQHGKTILPIFPVNKD